MLFGVIGIQIDQKTVLISLIFFDQRLVFIERKELTVGVFHQREVLSSIVEVFLGEHSVVDKELQMIPLLLVIFTVFFKNCLQTIGYFLRDIR